MAYFLLGFITGTMCTTAWIGFCIVKGWLK